MAHAFQGGEKRIKEKERVGRKEQDRKIGR